MCLLGRPSKRRMSPERRVRLVHVPHSHFLQTSCRSAKGFGLPPAPFLASMYVVHASRRLHPVLPSKSISTSSPSDTTITVDAFLSWSTCMCSASLSTPIFAGAILQPRDLYRMILSPPVWRPYPHTQCSAQHLLRASAAGPRGSSARGRPPARACWRPRPPRRAEARGTGRSSCSRMRCSPCPAAGATPCRSRPRRRRTSPNYRGPTCFHCPAASCCTCCRAPCPRGCRGRTCAPQPRRGARHCRRPRLPRSCAAGCAAPPRATPPPMG
mmetsp:Transcript_19512/g.47868  ORF Transcript_19512/g.47868 Transcript_19512/m.47868 type:complete len:270 (-) Transcript_19512:259-1068(-)